MLAVIVGNGPPPPKKKFQKYIRDADLLIAADGGARHFVAFKKIPDMLIGDFDSIDLKTLKNFQIKTKIYRFPKQKDDTDLKLAFLEAERSGATEIKVFSWADERIDYSLAAILNFSHSKSRVELISQQSSVRILNSHHSRLQIIRSNFKRFSVFSMGAETSLKSSGLRWNLEWDSVSASTFSQSNEVKDRTGELRLSGGAVFVVLEHPPLKGL